MPILKEPDDIVRISQSMFEHAWNNRLPIQQGWDNMWDRFNNIYDFSRKADWQSQGHIPKIPNAVRMASAILKKSLIRAKDFYTVSSELDLFRKFAPAVQGVLKAWLTENRFVEEFTESLVAGLLMNLMVFKAYWKSDEFNIDQTTNPISHDTGMDLTKRQKKISPEQALLFSVFPELSPQIQNPMVPANAPTLRRRGGLRIVPINPYFFLLDPTGRNKFCIHIIRMDLDDLKRDAAKKGYNQEVVNKIDEDFTKEWEYRETRRLRQTFSFTTTFRKQVVLYEYHGDLFDQNAKIAKQNATWTVANEKWLIRKPTDNPSWHGKWPFVWGPIVKRPFSVYHKGYLDDGFKLAGSITDLFNSLMDANAYSMAKAFEIDIDMVYDPEQIKGGVYPGKTFLKRSGGNPNTRLIQEVPLGILPAQSLRLYQQLDIEFQNSTGLTEFLVGKPSTKGRATATEIVEKGAQSMSIMEDIALDIEDTILSPLLEMCYKIILQYQTDFEDPRMQMLSKQVRQQLSAFAFLPKEEKMKAVNAFKFEVRGMSGVIGKRIELNKLTSALKQISVIPGALDRVDWNEVLKRVFDGMNIDSTKVLLSDERYRQKLQARQQALQQEQAAAGAQGGPAGQQGPQQPQGQPQQPRPQGGLGQLF
jgi:hypothetical protein